MPNGYIDPMWIFNILFKPALGLVHAFGYEWLVYEDCLLLADTLNEYHKNANYSIFLLQELGLVKHTEKSIFIPWQKITY